MSHFHFAFAELMEHEGGYVDNPSDPGGETKYGISKRSYPTLDIRNLTKTHAAEIYERDYWRRFYLHQIHDARVATKILLMCVVRRPETAVKLVQSALCAAEHPVEVDGFIGPKTIHAINASDPAMLLGALRSESANHFRRLVEKKPSLRVFLNGWLRRAYS